jgi:predicted nucleic acid-binding Zn finger protein
MIRTVTNNIVTCPPHSYFCTQNPLEDNDNGMFISQCMQFKFLLRVWIFICVIPHHLIISINYISHSDFWTALEMKGKVPCAHLPHFQCMSVILR